MFVYAMVDNCFEFDSDNKKYVCLHDIDEAKAIWLEYGSDILNLANNRFRSTFVSSCQTRKGDFVNQEALWSQLARTLNKKMKSATWKNRLNVVLKEAA